MSAAGRFLARRSHSESELRTKLRRFDPEAIDLVIGRLWELDLLDDAAFAAVWVEERGRRKGRRALESELRAKGVAGHLIEGALAGLAPVELDQATALAASFVRRVARKPLGQQGAAIAQMLVRRGYEWEVAEEAARAVLPPEGWD
jgi:regulatory protein